MQQKGFKKLDVIGMRHNVCNLRAAPECHVWRAVSRQKQLFTETEGILSNSLTKLLMSFGDEKRVEFERTFILRGCCFLR